MLLLLMMFFLCTHVFSLEEEGQREITFVAEHKTGSTITTNLMRYCFVRHTFRQSHEHWLDTTLTRTSTYRDNFTMHPQWGKIVYMVRNPYEMVLSNYFYSMACESRTLCWETEDFPHLTAQVAIRNTWALREQPLRGETYNAYLHRVSLADGIRATMAGVAFRVLSNMEKNCAKNSGLDRLVIICLGDIFRAYDKTMRLILRHFGLAADEEAWRCLKESDPSEHATKHGTHDVRRELRLEAMSLVREYDTLYFGKRFGNSPLTTRCAEEGLP